MITSPEEHVRRVALHESGMIASDMAVALGISRCAVYQWLRARGLSANPAKSGRKSHAPPPQGAPAFGHGRLRYRLARYRAGLTDTKIGRMEGTSAANVNQWRQRHGLPNWRGAEWATAKAQSACYAALVPYDEIAAIMGSPVAPEPWSPSPMQREAIGRLSDCVETIAWFAEQGMVAA